ncbi:MAG: hypothetical protein ACREKH_01245, partial [Candidatus Rokuibacteriota bacterium]
VGLAAGGRPFGGTLCISGEIPAALSLAIPDTLEYKLWATQGAVTIPIVAPFTVWVEEGIGPGIAVSHTLGQTPTPDGYFTYREHGSPAVGSWRRVSSPNRLLAYWNTSGLTGTWTIHVQARNTGTVAPIFPAGLTFCPDGSWRSSVKVTLDQQRPEASVTITGYTDAGGFHPGMPCDDFIKGVIVNGTWDITDNRAVGTYGFTLEPSGSVGYTVDPGSTATHVFGTWNAPTAALPPCGYVVHLEAYDMTIADCNGPWRDDATVGFCLRNPA